jgi:uncharacterized membrane protein YgcG
MSDEKGKGKEKEEKQKDKPKDKPKAAAPPRMVKISLQSFFDGCVIEGCQLEVRSDSDLFFPFLGNHIWVDANKHEYVLKAHRDKARHFAARQGGGGSANANWGGKGGAGSSGGGGGGGMDVNVLATLFEEGLTKAIAAVKSSEGASTSKEVPFPFLLI